MSEEPGKKQVSRTQKIIDVAIKLTPEFGVSEALRRALVAIPTTPSSRKRACRIFGVLVVQAQQQLDQELKQKEAKNVARKKTTKRKRKVL